MIVFNEDIKTMIFHFDCYGKISKGEIFQNPSIRKIEPIESSKIIHSSAFGNKSKNDLSNTCVSRGIQTLLTYIDEKQQSIQPCTKLNSLSNTKFNGNKLLHHTNEDVIEVKNKIFQEPCESINVLKTHDDLYKSLDRPNSDSYFVESNHDLDKCKVFGWKSNDSTILQLKIYIENETSLKKVVDKCSLLRLKDENKPIDFVRCANSKNQQSKVHLYSHLRIENLRFEINVDGKFQSGIGISRFKKLNVVVDKFQNNKDLKTKNRNSIINTKLGNNFVIHNDKNKTNESSNNTHTNLDYANDIIDLTNQNEMNNKQFHKDIKTILSKSNYNTLQKI